MISQLNLPFRLLGLQEVQSSWQPFVKAHEKKSAVCMLLSQSADNVNIILTRRSITVGSHKGQISFPGGMAEDNDQSPADAALREVQEELGIASDQITVIGVLPLATALGNFPVFTVVGVTAVTAQQMQKQASEVEEIIAVPWRFLTKDQMTVFKFNIYGNWVESPLYKVDHHHVWGLTAKIIQSAKISPSEL